MWGDEDHDAAGHAWLSLDEASLLETNNHLMDGRWCDGEVALHIGFGRGLPEHAGIDVDEGQILALLFGEASRAAGSA